MTMTISGDGTIAGLVAGGLPDGSVTPADLSQKMTQGTAVATTSGTSIDFTGIPSWAKRVTILLNGVSTSGTANLRFQIGDSGGVATTGYVSSGGYVGASSASLGSTGGFDLYGDAGATIVRSGAVVLNNVSSNTWVVTGNMSSGGAYIFTLAGIKSLSNALDRVRITSSNGTDTFDAGSVNILYEG